MSTKRGSTGTYDRKLNEESSKSLYHSDYSRRNSFPRDLEYFDDISQSKHKKSQVSNFNNSKAEDENVLFSIRGHSLIARSLSSVRKPQFENEKDYSPKNSINITCYRSIPSNSAQPRRFSSSNKSKITDYPELDIDSIKRTSSALKRLDKQINSIKKNTI